MPDALRWNLQAAAAKPASWQRLRFKGQDPPHEVTTVIVPPSAEIIFPLGRRTEAAPFVVFNIPQYVPACVLTTTVGAGVGDRSPTARIPNDPRIASVPAMAALIIAC